MPARPPAVEIHGEVSPGYEAVAEAFRQNFLSRGEVGAAVSVWREGRTVVDLWGGLRDPATGAPWQRDTMVIVFSATKGMSALALALAHSRGWLDYDAPVARYWPEFAQNGKAAITVRQLLAHQAGLHAFDQPVDAATIADPDRLAEVIARERPAWPAGTRTAYHAITLGFYQSELLRRVDPRHRTLGRFFADEIAAPLGIEFHIRLSPDIPDARLAPVIQPGLLRSVLGLPLRVIPSVLNPRSHFFRAVIANPGTAIGLDPARIYARDFEVPSGGGVGTARAIARAYGAFSASGGPLGLGAETLDQLMAPDRPPAAGYRDAVLKSEVHFSLGFMKPFAGFPFGHKGAFGAPGAGGAMGYADPARGLGYGYVMNRMGTGISADRRDVALRQALDSVTG